MSSLTHLVPPLRPDSSALVRNFGWSFCMNFMSHSVHRLVSSANLAARALLGWSVVRLIVLVVAYLLSVARVLGHKY
jgi:hypothetical protein